MAAKEIRSHLPGIFYRSASPDEPPFKADGDAVASGDVIGLVEVMKSFHEVQADVSGTNIRFVVDNEAAVTAGAVLAELDD